MKVTSSDEIRHYELCDQGIDVFDRGKCVARIPAEDIDRLSRILRKQAEIERIKGEIEKIADGTEDVPGF